MSKVWARLGAAVGAVALLAGGLVGVAAPASADSKYIGNAWLDCGDGRIIFASINGFGGGACDTDKEEVTILKECGDLTEFQCPLVEVGPPKDDEAEADAGANGATSAIRTDPGAGMTWVEGPVCSAQSPGDGWVPVDAGDFCVKARDGRSAWALKGPIEEGESEQVFTPPPPCWDASINNCPVGGALRFAAPEYAMVGVPITMYAYASWLPDVNSPAQPTNGTAVIRVDGEDYSGVEFKDGVAEWRFIPEEEGMKEFTVSAVVFSGLSGASAYIDTVPARTYVLEYDPAAYMDALKKKLVEVGEKFTITDRDQAKSYLNDRYEWRVAENSKDVCAVYETKKGAIKAKFNEAGKCKVIWTDTESGEKGKFSFVAKK